MINMMDVVHHFFFLQVGRHYHLMELLLSWPAIEINAQDDQVLKVTVQCTVYIAQWVA